jgi:hypothetical protein
MCHFPILLVRDFHFHFFEKRSERFDEDDLLGLNENERERRAFPMENGFTCTHAQSPQVLMVILFFYSLSIASNNTPRTMMIPKVRNGHMPLSHDEGTTE